MTASLSVRPVQLTSAAAGAEQVGGGGTPVTVPSHHVGATLALPAARITHGAEGSLRVTLARWEERRGNTLRGRAAVVEKFNAQTEMFYSYRRSFV